MTTTSSDQRWRILVSAPGVVDVVTEPAVELGAGEALVSMRIAGVCGSDTHALHGKHPQMKPPYYPGHEVVGVVEAVASDVTGLAVGTRVTPEPTLPCGECKVCRAGNVNVCENLGFFGCGYREGGMAQTFSIPADRLRVVPEDFSDDQAILIEPLATPVHAAGLTGDLQGKAVLIHGCGTIGLLMLAAARAAGARRIVVSDLLGSKREIALRLGADAAVDAADADFVGTVAAALGESADVVFDCVSVQTTVDVSVRVVAQGGAVVIVGVPSRPVTVDLPTVQDRQIRIQGAATYVTADYERAIEIIRSGAVDPTVMLTSRFDYARAADAFDLASTGTEIKVVITVD
ncbi:alcohol dehydrogenase catalytic domain-containing protein [Microbacterium sp. zg.B48]|uniref:zinc-dependent alcohol dehydrogenase n=1 Tax=Microbacterium sp. zg.B48 TaxID=2969408 RepID=UPI00214CBB7D|nr:alcohol dehydrogenase catalytic domain-containing protein [Microbacterium sp. zg.B48]MCR2762816.1 alcohol dehydrogenase catalytic domain-containing protein [Microbacterium sp. zg.B48]